MMKSAIQRAKEKAYQRPAPLPLSAAQRGAILADWLEATLQALSILHHKPMPPDLSDLSDLDAWLDALSEG